MKKSVKFIMVLVFLLTFFTQTVSAEQLEEEMYLSQYESSGLNDVFDALPNETKELLESFDIDLSNINSITNIKTKNVFEIIWEFISNGAKKPFSIAFSVMGMILIFSAVSGLAEIKNSFALTVIICFGGAVMLFSPLYETVISVEEAIKAISGFMLAFIPVYSGIMISSGLGLSAGGFSTLLLAAAEALSYFVSFGFVPLMGSCMCLSICSGISPVSVYSKIGEFIKKSINWFMGIATTVFVSIVSVQTSLQGAADNLGLKTSKAVLSGSIPVVGSAIAETLTAAKGCIELLRSGAGIYAALAILIMMLPLTIELLLWRLGLWLCCGTSEIFEMNMASGFFKSLDYCVSVLVGALVLVSLLFIISLGVTVRVM